MNRICVCDIINTNINWDFTISDTGIYTQKCVSECDNEYEPNNISKRCIESCLDYKHYMVNDICFYDGCPSGYKLNEENGHICICENYFYLNNINNLECFDSFEDCESNNLLYYNEESSQCFSSLNDCFLKDFNYYFNNKCYNNECPSQTIQLSDIDNIDIKNKFIYYLELEDELIDKICVCDIISDSNLKWTYDSINKFQNCLNICPDEIYENEPEELTHKCLEKCNPLIDYVFNGNCYKNNCPLGTKLKNDGTRNCICEESFYINEENNEMICCNEENRDDINCFEDIIYPLEYYENSDKCLAVYQGKCYEKCPEGTCLTQRDINLIYCIQKQGYMTVINNICFTNFNEIEKNIKNISDNDLYILPSPNIMIKAYTKFSEIDEINSNFSYIELGECENELKNYYKLPNETILYILGIETPDKNKKSAINTYNYRVYLENGTELNLSICIGKIQIFSTINNRDIIKLDKANYFDSFGFNIYNKSDIFYNDFCCPASIYGNDITLNDRYNDFYPSNI